MEVTSMVLMHCHDKQGVGLIPADGRDECGDSGAAGAAAAAAAERAAEGDPPSAGHRAFADAQNKRGRRAGEGLPEAEKSVLRQTLHAFLRTTKSANLKVCELANLK
eukprot:scaffold192855_cov15-Tisochrysis_lutea.AAC.2